jgi:6-phosphogluconolactonase
MELIHCNSEEEFNNVCSLEIAKLLEKGSASSVQNTERNAKRNTDPNTKSQTFKIALSGGNTPRKNYENLGNSKLDLSKVDFFIADERYVKKNHKAANANLISKSLQNLPAGKKAKYHFWQTQLSIEDCLTNYKNVLPTQFDLIFLGIGKDGHFASLFPGTDLKNKKKTLHTQTNEFEIKDRLTLSVKTILKAKKIVVLLQNKPQVLEELTTPTKTAQKFPANILKSHQNLVVYYI